MPPLRIQQQTCSSLTRKINNGLAIRSFGTGRANTGIRVGNRVAGRQSQLLFYRKKNMQRISAHSMELRVAVGVAVRGYATASPADAIIEELTEQYSVARDEFEIATEETEKKSVYAADDRAAAQEELQKLKEMYGSAIEGEYGEEIKRRVGQRLRELEQGILALEERAQEDH